MSIDEVATILPQPFLDSFCTRWGISELAVFGSGVNGSLSSANDLDLLYELLPDVHLSLLQVVQMQEELETKAGCPIDLVRRSAIARSTNSYRKTEILDSARVICAVGKSSD